MKRSEMVYAVRSTSNYWYFAIKKREEQWGCGCRSKDFCEVPKHRKQYQMNIGIPI